MPRLTKKFVDRLRPNSEKDFCVWDDDIAGFGVRLNPGGKKTYIFQYRNKLHKERKYKIGIHGIINTEDAREAAFNLRRQVKQEGIDPAEIKNLESTLLKEQKIENLAEKYFHLHAIPSKKPRDVREDKALYTGYIQPNFAHLPVKNLESCMLELWRLTMRHKPIRANRVLSLLSKMFSLAIKWGWCDKNPVIGVTRYPEHKRERWLKDDELERLWSALEPYESYPSANVIRILLLTGSRLGEVLNATWNQFDLDAGVWTKPFTHTKQKKTEHLPLSTPALLLFKKMKEESKGPFLFCSRSDIHKPLTNINKFWRKLLKETEIENIRIHDLRHTYASHLVSNGVSLSAIGKLLGHTQAATTQRYAHLADQALRDATNVFGNKIASLKKNSTSSQES